jgi:KRAB domain-containing zinc finger protein
MKTYSCDVEDCDYSSKDKSNFQRHQQLTHHLGVKWFGCTEKLCDKRFKDKRTLREHISSCHSDQSDWFECPEKDCDFKCSRKAGLDQHRKNIHEEPRIWYECSEEGCDYRGKTKYALQGHIHRNHDSDAVKYMCSECNYSSINRTTVKGHERAVHQKIDRWFPCDIEKCEEKFSTKMDLRYHKAVEHDINREEFFCGYKGCPHTSKVAHNLKVHRERVHDKEFNSDREYILCQEKDCDYRSFCKKNVFKHLKAFHKEESQWRKCQVEGCEKKYKTLNALASHVKTEHEETWFSCNEKGCSYKTRSKTCLTSHRERVHSTEIHRCSVKGCSYQGKSRVNLNRHKRRVHNPNCLKFFCDECDYSSIQKSHVQRHQIDIHGKKFKSFICGIEDCSESFSYLRDLDYHKAVCHNIDRERFFCGIDNCSYSAKAKPSLVGHRAYVHDLGDKECQVCFKNVYSLNSVLFQKKRFNVCRNCYQRMSGKFSRVEKRMSDWLDKNYGTEFLLSTDKPVSGDVCRRYRPDKLYADPERVIQIECDEYQHSRSTGDYSCDEKRISEIYDEFPGKEYIVIRWNPHGFCYPRGQIKGKKKPNISERLEILLLLLEKLESISFESPITVIYLFYSPENPNICQNITKRMVYSSEDVENL